MIKKPVGKTFIAQGSHVLGIGVIKPIVIKPISFGDDGVHFHIDRTHKRNENIREELTMANINF